MLDFIISSANAAPAAGGQPPVGAGIAELVLIGVFMLFTFFLIRTQSKKQKAQREMLNSVQKGDEVVVSGGIIGKVNKLTEDFLVINISDSVDIKVQKHAVSAVLPKGTIKAIG